MRPAGRGARSAGIGGARTALPGDDPHGANTRDSVDATDRAILETLAGADGRSTHEIAEAIGLITRATRTRLARLKDRGLVCAGYRAERPETPFLFDGSIVTHGIGEGC
ncbi:MAG: winged helix-turn-helix transcriptional regulator [Casimicrobiaceae bacterium]